MYNVWHVLSSVSNNTHEDSDVTGSTQINIVAVVIDFFSVPDHFLSERQFI